jgi:hypothetical protein
VFSLFFCVNSTISVTSVGDEQPVAIVGDGVDGISHRFVGEGDGVRIKVPYFWPGVEDSGNGINLVDFVGLAYFFDVGFDFPDIFGEKIEQERIYLWFEFDSLLHVEHEFAFCVGVVVDGGKSGLQDATTLGSNNEDILVYV